MSDKLLKQILEKITQIESDVSSIKMCQDGMKEDVTAIRYNQEATNATLKALSDDVTYIKGDIAALKENQQKIMSIQQDQQKILERLSIRSISQEADIAELRRIK